MNRLVLVRCFVVACYVAAAAYTASFVASYILLELDRSRVGAKIPTFVSKGGEIYRDFSSRIKQASYPKKPVAIAEEPAAAGPSVDTPISHFYAVSTPLRATRQRDG